jgi:hypothetical protein
MNAFTQRLVPIEVEESIKIPPAVPGGEVRTIMVKVPAMKDPNGGGIYFGVEAARILDRTKARHMGRDLKSIHCVRSSTRHATAMKNPGLDGRHRDNAGPKGGQIDQKHSNTINKNLPRPIEGFSPLATVKTMRKETGKVGIEAIRKAAKTR